MKTFFACLILCSSILAVPFVVKAYDIPTPTPTLEESCSLPDHSCGGCIQSNGQPLQQLCCGSKLTDAFDTSKANPSGDDGPCLLFICVGGLINNATKLLSDTITSNFSTLHDAGADDAFSQSLGTCHENEYFKKALVPDANDPTKAVCGCVPNVNNTKALATNFCTTYLASQKHINAACVAKLKADVVPVGIECTQSDLTKLRRDPDIISCTNCFLDGGYWSAIGCVHLNSFQQFIEQNVFGWGLGLAGTFALGCIIYAAIQMQLSNGVPDRVKKSQEMLTSCIMGLMVIIFSIFILRLIGVTILHIPGFS